MQLGWLSNRTSQVIFNQSYTKNSFQPHKQEHTQRSQHHDYTCEISFISEYQKFGITRALLSSRGKQAIQNAPPDPSNTVS
jgi:hypothetical protein